jgi:hypothetical protein
MTYTHILDLAKEAEPPADGILSRTIFQDDQIKAVVFGFGQGQELSERGGETDHAVLREGRGDRGPGRRSKGCQGWNLVPRAGGTEALDQSEDASGDAVGAVEVRTQSRPSKPRSQRMTHQPTLRKPTEGRTIAVVGDLSRFLATGDDANGKYAMFEAIVPPGGGPPPHVHSRDAALLQERK